MKTIHLFEDHIYLISNYSVARNPMFSSLSMQDYFKMKMEKYLLPITEILAYSMIGNEFQILVKLKMRKTFCAHYNSYQNTTIPFAEIPETTYIFSQAMANLQISFVKHFNFVHKRSGTLVASRFGRKLIESENEMNGLVEKLNKGEERPHYSGIWINEIMKERRAMTSVWLYGENLSRETKCAEGYLNARKADLGASFKILPPYRLPSTNNFFFHQIFKIFRQNAAP